MDAETGAPTAAGADLAAALAMIAELPLTPAEKAEAVRRLLNNSAVGRSGGEPKHLNRSL